MTDNAGNLPLPPGAHVHGDVFTGGKHIYNYFIQGLDALPTHLDVNARVRKFLEYYVGTPEAPAPFGGRAVDLAALDGWLKDPAAPPYALLAAPAGRGKSGLLAHWVTRLALAQAEGAPPRHIVFFPISLRFNTNSENVVFVGLAARLAHIYGETLGEARDVLQYRGLFSEYLRRPPPDGAPVLVVVDGLDEAAGWEALNDLFPYSPQPHLRVLAAARLLAGDPEGQGWLARLGWEAPGRARRLSLDALDRDGVADVLVNMGNPLRGLAANYDLITKLCELSEGDPLLVRLYVEALLPYQGQAAALTPADLETLQPGLEAYFNRWFEEQQTLSGVDPQEDERVDALLSLCAVALGPLQKADALELEPDLFKRSAQVDQAARAVNRFILGDGGASGYAFSHPRLDDYFAGRLTPKERRRWLERFRGYGRRTVAALQAGDLPAVETSPYLLQFYGAHLDPDPAKPPDAAILDLLSEAWLRAHEAVTGSPTGFLADARRAWRRAQADGPGALGQQVLAALCFASLTSLSASLPVDLLVQGAATGLLSPALAVVLARQKADPFERATALARLSPHAPPGERDALLTDALTAAGQITNYDADLALLAIAAQAPPDFIPPVAELARQGTYVRRRAEVLAALGARLAEAEAAPLWHEALALARAEEYEDQVTHLLGVLAYLPPAAHLDLVREAQLAADELEREYDRALFLAEVSGYLPEAEQPAVMQAAFESATGLEDDGERASVLMRLADRLPPAQREQVQASLAVEFNRAAAQPRLALKGGPAAEERAAQDYWADLLNEYAPFLPEPDIEKALQHAWTIDEVSIRTRALAAVALRLPPAQRREVIAQALASTLREDDESSRLHALEYLLDKTPDELLPDAVAAVRTVPVRDQRAQMLARLAARLPPAQARSVMAEALEAARALNDETYQAEALAALARQLPVPQRDAILAQAWRVIQAIPLESVRLNQCEKFAAQPMPASLVDELLAQARAARSELDGVNVLAALAPQLAPAQLAAALEFARNASNSWRCRALLALAACLPEAEAALVYAEAAETARASEYSRPEDLLAVAKAVPAAMRPAAVAEAAEAIRQSAHPHNRARWLSEASDLAEDEQDRRKILAGAFTAVTEIRDAYVRAENLALLAPCLPEDCLHAAVQTAAAIENPYDAAMALTALASRLPAHSETWQAALDRARTLQFPGPITSVLAALTGTLPPDQRGPLIAEARSHFEQEAGPSRAQVILDYAQRLPEPDRLAALRLAVQVAEAHQPWWLQTAHGALLAALPQSEREAYARQMLQVMPTLSETDTQKAAAVQAQALRRLYDGLPSAFLAEALRLAWPLANYGDAETVIRLLGPRWAEMCQASGEDPFELLTGTLRAYIRAPRSTLLAALAALAPAVALAGGPKAMEAVANAILDAGRWWT